MAEVPKLRRVHNAGAAWLPFLLLLLQPCCPARHQAFASGVWEGELSVLMGEGRSPIYFLNLEGALVELAAQAPIDTSLYGRRVRVTGTYGGANALVAASVEPVPGAPQPQNPTTGEQRSLVIALKFSDTVTTAHDPGYFQDLVFGEMDRYFREASYNKTFFRGTVSGWYVLPKEYSHYVNATSGGFFRERLDELVDDAVAAADSDVYYPECLRLYLVFNREINAIGSFGLWTVNTEDGKVKVSISWISENDPLGIWVHETGHNLGLPDLYDSEGKEEFVGRWDAMAEGAWNHFGLSPAHFSSYCKLRLGWIPQDRKLELPMGQDGPVTLNALESGTQGCQVVRVSIGGSKYYLVEVRKREGYDLHLPDSGVLVIYVDESTKPEKGGVRVVDSTPSTPSLDDATFDARAGKSRNWLNTTLKLTMIVSGTFDGWYELRFSYGEQVIVDLAHVSRSRAEVGSEQTIGFRALWEKSGLPADVILDVSGSRLRTNATGWATGFVTSEEVGLVSYNVSSVETPSGVSVAFDQRARPEIVWDRLVVEWGALRSRVDVGSEAKIFGTVYYEYDGEPASGTVSINWANVSVISGSFTYDAPPVSRVTRRIYALTSAWGSEHSISSFEASPPTLEVVYDRARVIFSTSTPRIEVGSNATVTYVAYYEHDGSPFVGRIVLNDEEFAHETVGMSVYTAAGIEDEKYGLTNFTANEAFVSFDRIVLESTIDSFVPGKVRVTVRLIYESDSQPVDGASVTVDGVPAREVGTGIFEAELGTWGPLFSCAIAVSKQ
ncbi:MAG: M6 family metalloprotease domain-containing protein, partial [Thermoproteota archaeon]